MATPEPFVTILQKEIYQKRALHVEPLAACAGVSRVTMWGWVNGRWPLPLYGARKIVKETRSPLLAHALVAETGLHVIPRLYVEQPQPLFFLLANHMATYARLLELVGKLDKQTITQTELDEARTLIVQFADLNDQIAIRIEQAEEKAE